MPIAIFAQQTETIESQLSKLQQLVEAKRRQQALVTEADQLSSQPIESLKSALVRVPDATSDLAVVAVDGTKANPTADK
jgi:type II secretory pathway predicted ATPase ExeA